MPVGVLVLLGFLVSFGPLSIDMYLPALETIAKDLGAPIDVIQLTLASFFVGISLGQVFYGPAADRFGRKPPLYFGLLIYALASALCAVTSNPTLLITLRFFQAIGSCAGMVVTRAMVRDLFRPEEGAKIFSMLMLVMGAAPILAPSVGGAVATTFGWRPIFVIQAVAALICLWRVHESLPETHGPEKRALFSGRFSETLRNYLGILRDRRFMIPAVSGGIAQAGMFAYITGSPFVLMNLMGLPPGRYAVVFGCNAVGLIAVSQINRFFVGKFGLERTLASTFGVIALIGTVFLQFGLSGAAPIPLMSLMSALFLYVASMGAMFPNSGALAMADQAHIAGSASALLGTIQMLIAAVLSGVVSHFHDGTAAPMCLTIAAAGIGSAFVHFAGTWLRNRPLEQAPKHD